MVMLGDDEEDAAPDPDVNSDGKQNPGSDPPIDIPPPVDNPPDFNVSSGDEPSTASGFPPPIDNPPERPTIIRARTPDDDPPLRAPDDEKPENPHVPEEEEEEGE